MSELETYFDKLGKNISNLGKKLEKNLKTWGEEIDSTFKNFEDAFDSGGVNIQESNGITLINSNGNIEIKGNIKTLKVNGKKIML